MRHPKTDPVQRENPVLSLSGRVSVSPRMSQKDKKSFSFSYWLAYEILMQDQPCSDPRVVGGFKRLLNSLLETGDALGYIEACSWIRQQLVSSGSWERIPFKESKLRWTRGILSAVTHAVETSLCVHPSRLFNTVVTYLGFLKRLPVCIQDPEIGKLKYIQADARLRSIDFDQNEHISSLRQIWIEWFAHFAIHPPFLPRHGSGSTADSGRVRSVKWANLYQDRAASICFRYPNLETCSELPIGNPSRTSKLVFVPKQAGKDRTICMEPAWLQYLQQGVTRQLVEYTHRGNHPLSAYVNIYSQDQNRSLCAQAYYLNLATIDLSDASDSVSWRLISALTKGLPIYRYLFGCRSTMTSISGDVMSFDKYAPMGSALCFPIECYVFASIVELAYRIHFGKASQGAASGCSVYGDDIICPSEIYHLVVSILTSLGFIVNSEKSFSSGRYYESCGVEYCDGVLIRTIKHPRSHLGCTKAVSPEEVGMITDLSNTLYESCYFRARRFLLVHYKDKVVRIGNKTRPFMDLMNFSDGGCTSILSSYDNTHWNNKIQRRVRQVWSCLATNRPSKYDHIDTMSTWRIRTRSERLKPKGIRDYAIRPELSDKAVISFLRFGWTELLESDDIPRVGSTRAGRLHYRLRKKLLLT